MSSEQEEIDELAKHLVVVLLAEWIAIEHNEPRLQAHKYYEEGQDLADWLFVIGYRLINPTG